MTKEEAVKAVEDALADLARVDIPIREYADVLWDLGEEIAEKRISAEEDAEDAEIEQDLDEDDDEDEQDYD